MSVQLGRRKGEQFFIGIIFDTITGKIRRGGYVFITWTGDHPPRHVHVCRDGKPIVKWDLERGRDIEGNSTRRIRRYIAELMAEGRL